METPRTDSVSFTGEEALRFLEILLIVIAGVAVFWATFPGPLGANDLSRFATAESLVERGTFIIDDSPFGGTVDRVRIGEGENAHYLSTKPPVMPVLMAAEYWVLKHVFRLDFSDPGELRALFKIITFTFCGIPFVITCFLFRRGLHWFVPNPLTRVVMLFACCFATEVPAFAVTLNNHVPGAAILFGAFLVSVGLVHGRLRPEAANFIFAGFLAGLLPTFELPGAVFSVLCWLYLLHRFPRETLIWFTVGAVPPLFLHFFLSYLSSGSLIPVYMRSELYDYPGSYWNNPQGIDALREPKPLYFFHMLFGHHGLFLVWPVFLVALVATVRAIFSKSFPLRREVLGVGFFVLFSIIFYGMSKHNYGGEAYPVRWFIYFMPAFLFAGALGMKKTRSAWKWVAVAVLIGISMYSVQECWKWPWTGRKIWTRAIFPIEY
jgi:hypothetical protein